MTAGTVVCCSMRALAERFRSELSALIEHCVHIERGGASVSDFPLLALSQAELEGLALDFRRVADIYPMIDRLAWVKDRGRTLGVIGTPNFFVQGKLVKSVIGIQEIREMVDPILAGRVAATDGPAKAR